MSKVSFLFKLYLASCKPYQTFDDSERYVYIFFKSTSLVITILFIESMFDEISDIEDVSRPSQYLFNEIARKEDSCFAQIGSRLIYGPCNAHALSMCLSQGSATILQKVTHFVFSVEQMH